MNRELKPLQLFFYGLPGLPLAMLGLPLFVYLPSYYSQSLGLSLSAVGLALLLARSLDVVTDPLIGLLNDRYPKFQSQLWRRKSFIIAGIPVLLIGLNYLLKPETGISALYLFGWSFITYLGWTLINIPWLALGAEVSQDYHEKSALASSREIFAVIGTVTVISLPVLLSIQSDLKQTLEILANLLTILLPLTLIPLLWNLSDKTRFTTGIKPIKSSFKNRKLLSKQLLEVVSHPAIKKLLPAYFVNSIANALPATLFILFVTHVLQIPEKVGVLLICYFLSAIAGIPLWLYLARKTDKHRSWSIALIVSIASFIWVPLLGQGDFNAFLLICLASGFALGADVVMPASIQADISQDISLKKPQDNVQLVSKKLEHQESHQESTGVLFGLWGLLTKLSLALAIGISFPLLDIMGLKTGANLTEGSSEMAQITLVILYSLIPVIFKLWVVLQMWHFPFGRSYFTSQLSPQLSPQQENTKEGKHYENLNSEILTRPVSNLTHNQRVQ